MSRIKFTEEQEKEILNYYLVPHLTSDTAKMFNISEYYVIKILDKYNIKKHSASVINSLTSVNQLQGKNIKNEHFNSLFLIDETLKYNIINDYIKLRSLDAVLKSHKELQNINKVQLKHFLLKNNIVVDREYYHKIFTKEQKLEIIAFYLKPNTAAATIARFKDLKLNKTSLNLILNELNIEKHSKEVINKIRQDNSLNKYGVTYPQQSDMIRSKIEQTCLIKYGCKNYFSTEEYKQYISEINKKRTFEEKEAIKIKRVQTCNTKYGVDNPFQSEYIKDKAKQTSLIKYGTEFPIQNTDIKEKAKQSHAANHENGWYDTDKMRTTCFEKYGVNWYSKTIDFNSKIRKKYYYNNIGFDSLPELAVYIYYIDNNKTIKRADLRFEYWFKDKLYYYFPDFEIDGRLVEIKGDQFFKEDGTMQNPFDHSQDELFEAKRQCMIKNNIEIWTSKDYKFALDYFKDKKYNIEDYSI